MYSGIYGHHCYLNGCHNNPVCDITENITDTVEGKWQTGENFLLMKVYFHTVIGLALLFQHAVLKSLG